MQSAHLWTVQGSPRWLYIHDGDNVQEDVVQGLGTSAQNALQM